MNINTYYCWYSYCNRTETVVSPVSDEKRFPRVWRKANSFWEEKKHVELLSDTGLINVLNKLPVNDSVIEQVTSRPIAYLIWLLDWLINLIDQLEQLLAVLPDNRHSDWHDWMTSRLTDDCWTYWYNWFSCTHLPHVPNCLTYLAYWLTNILIALLTKRHTNGQTDWLTELILYGAVRLTIITDRLTHRQHADWPTDRFYKCEMDQWTSESDQSLKYSSSSAVPCISFML